MNLAHDLLRKSTGYIHEMPLSTEHPVKLYETRHTANPSKCSQYFDECGQPCSMSYIANKYQATPAKVKKLFDKNTLDDFYSLIGSDQRSKNGKYDSRGKTYALPSGEYCTSQEVADYYGISRSSIQRTWVDNGKDSIRSNQHLMEKHFGYRSKV
jgi:hypothetical protein